MAEESLMSRKNIIILSLMIIIMGGVSYSVLVFINHQKNNLHEVSGFDKSTKIVKLDPVIISIFKENRLKESVLAGHLKIQLGFLVADTYTEKEIQNNKYKIINMINDLISGEKPADLSDNDKVENEKKMRKLKSKIQLAVNKLFKAKKVLEVYFNQYFFQPLTSS